MVTEKKSFKSEVLTRKLARRSLVAKYNIKKGQKITEKLLIPKRPGTGIPPYQINKILGKKAKKK